MTEWIEIGTKAGFLVLIWVFVVMMGLMIWKELLK